MTELLNIWFMIISLLIIFNFPINFFIFEKKFNELNLTYSDSLLINTILISNFLFVTSFFSLNLNYLFNILIFCSIVLIFKNFKDYLSLFKKKFIISVVFLIIFYSMSVQIAHNGYLEWDGMAHWIIKAKVFFAGGSYEDLKNVPFNYYPHLGSYIWAFFWDNNFMKYEYLGRIFFIFIFLLTTFSIISRFSQKLNVIEQIIIVTIVTYILKNFYLFGGYQEYLVFFSFFCFSYFLLYFNQNYTLYKRNIFPEIIIIFIVNIMMWSKQEGFFYGIILSIIFLVYSKRKLIFKSAYFFLFLLIISLFVYIKIYYFDALKFNDQIINNEITKNFDIVYLSNKIFLISKYFIITFFKYPYWILIIYSFILLKKNTNYFQKNTFFIPSFLIMICFVFAIFLQTPIDLNFLLPVTLNRIVFAISGLYLILPIEYYLSLKQKLVN